MKYGTREILYLHLQASERFVLSYGMTFREFTYSLNHPLQNILLLKAKSEDAEFNMNTLLDFIPRENVAKLVKDDINNSGDFCWIDFDEEIGLDELDGPEIAELLYLGHCKNHLNPPFYGKLNNQFVYLAHDDGWFNKVYYRSIDSFYGIVGNLFTLKLELLKLDRTWLGIRKKNEYTQVPSDVLVMLSRLMQEGAVFSFAGIQQNRNRLEIPIWVVGDYLNMDDMLDAFDDIKKQPAAAKLTYQRKSQEWSVIIL
ncbi:hypothetical protein D0469_15110 [Peribacillus saganii]|uniref:Oxalate:formate antiporter n=1 Tax=Peribacillus saganii TaxID=2303992 RepID=A0A372LM42_9BACI|nr:hypothetical protein [Peribacillus saganii]RFU67396.1 hypothetical protein D0469_15110 [Peribacillus saganii]